MYQKNTLLHVLSMKSIAFRTLLMISLVSWISSVRGADQLYDDCAPSGRSCGIRWKISYPFWDSRQQEYCGHPAFKLTCVDDTTLTINFENQAYNILSINYNSRVLTIVNPVLSKDICPNQQKQLTNTTLDMKFFSYSSTTQNSTLFYSCTQPNSAEDRLYAFSCSIGGSYSNQEFGSKLGYMTVDQKWAQKLQGLCEFQIKAPIYKSAAADLVNGKLIIADVLKEGFEAKWKVDDGDRCNQCMESGGRCGYNHTLDETICLCKHGVFYRSCGESSQNSSMLHMTPPTAPKADQKQSTNKYAVAIALIIIFCVLSSCILCFCFYRRHRKKNAAVHFLDHNKSYDLSSTGSSTQFLTGSTYFGVQVFNYRELEVATEYFNPSKELGEGGFGTVYYGRLQDGREVAIKRLYENNSKRAEQFLNEVEILANLRHKNLVNLYGCTSRQSRELLLVYEYVSNGTVADHLHGKKSKIRPLPWSTRLSIATETASALVYLHDSDIIHRDVKTQNVLLEDDFSVKVADFGLSRLFPLDVTHVSTAPQGTPGYVDPEYHQCYQLTEKSDVYSFGVMLAELLSSLPAVDITRKRNEINLSTMAINKIQNRTLHEFVDSSLGFESDLKIKEEITTVAELCYQCLQSTKEMRPTMNEVLKKLLVIQFQDLSKMNWAEVVDIPADDVLMLKGDFSPASPPREDNLANRYKPNASV